MKVKGSYTVEAALLMTILMPLLIGILYLGFYLHNVTVMRRGADELAAVESMEEGKGEEIRKRLSRAFFGMDAPQIQVRRDDGQVTVVIEGNFQIPGLTARLFGTQKLHMTARAEMELLHPERVVMRMHRLSRRKKEKEHEDDVSP